MSGILRSFYEDSLPDVESFVGTEFSVPYQDEIKLLGGAAQGDCCPYAIISSMMVQAILSKDSNTHKRISQILEEIYSTYSANFPNRENDALVAELFRSFSSINSEEDSAIFINSLKMRGANYKAILALTQCFRAAAADVSTTITGKENDDGNVALAVAVADAFDKDNFSATKYSTIEDYARLLVKHKIAVEVYAEKKPDEQPLDFIPIITLKLWWDPKHKNHYECVISKSDVVRAETPTPTTPRVNPSDLLGVQLKRPGATPRPERVKSPDQIGIFEQLGDSLRGRRRFLSTESSDSESDDDDSSIMSFEQKDAKATQSPTPLSPTPAAEVKSPVSEPKPKPKQGEDDKFDMRRVLQKQFSKLDGSPETPPEAVIPPKPETPQPESRRKEFQQKFSRSFSNLEALIGQRTASPPKDEEPASVVETPTEVAEVDKPAEEIQVAKETEVVDKPVEETEEVEQAKVVAPVPTETELRQEQQQEKEQQQQLDQESEAATPIPTSHQRRPSAVTFGGVEEFPIHVEADAESDNGSVVLHPEEVRSEDDEDELDDDALSNFDREAEESDDEDADEAPVIQEQVHEEQVHEEQVQVAEEQASFIEEHVAGAETVTEEEPTHVEDATLEERVAEEIEAHDEAEAIRPQSPPPPPSRRASVESDAKAPQPPLPPRRSSVVSEADKAEIEEFKEFGEHLKGLIEQLKASKPDLSFEEYKELKDDISVAIFNFVVKVESVLEGNAIQDDQIIFRNSVTIICDKLTEMYESKFTKIDLTTLDANLTTISSLGGFTPLKNAIITALYAANDLAENFKKMRDRFADFDRRQIEDVNELVADINESAETNAELANKLKQIKLTAEDQAMIDRLENLSIYFRQTPAELEKAFDKKMSSLIKLLGMFDKALPYEGEDVNNFKDNLNGVVFYLRKAMTEGYVNDYAAHIMRYVDSIKSNVFADHPVVGAMNSALIDAISAMQVISQLRTGQAVELPTVELDQVIEEPVVAEDDYDVDARVETSSEDSDSDDEDVQRKRTRASTRDYTPRTPSQKDLYAEMDELLEHQNREFAKSLPLSSQFGEDALRRPSSPFAPHEPKKIVNFSEYLEIGCFYKDDINEVDEEFCDVLKIVARSTTEENREKSEFLFVKESNNYAMYDTGYDPATNKLNIVKSATIVTPVVDPTAERSTVAKATMEVDKLYTATLNTLRVYRDYTAQNDLKGSGKKYEVSITNYDINQALAFLRAYYETFKNDLHKIDSRGLHFVFDDETERSIISLFQNPSILSDYGLTKLEIKELKDAFPILNEKAIFRQKAQAASWKSPFFKNSKRSRVDDPSSSSNLEPPERKGGGASRFGRKGNRKA